MHIVSDLSSLTAFIAQCRKEGKSIGFVPTMGALHQGHISLVSQSLSQHTVTVVSIFVNPTQFGPLEDLSRYPRPIEKDQAMLAQLGVTCLFLPTEATIYPQGTRLATRIEVPALSTVWCGKTRPHHFRGVCMVVMRLLQLVSPDTLYLGEKDFQQLAIIKVMTQDLFIPVQVVACPIVRESHGLAMSSRNQYLSDSQRREAGAIYQGLCAALALFEGGETRSVQLLEKARVLIAQKLRIDYLTVIDPMNLKAKKVAQHGDRIIFAGFLGQTRLLDNLALKNLVKAN